MRFLFTSEPFTPHHIRLLQYLGSGMQEASGGGNEIWVMGRSDLTKHLDGADVVLGINMARPDFLPARVRYITWVQDIINWPKEGEPAERELFAARSGPDDIIYTLGDGLAVGVDENDPHWRGSLSPGVSEPLLNVGYEEPNIDLTLCAYIPPALGSWAALNDDWVRILAEAIRVYYRTLRGELDPMEMLAKIKAPLLQVAVDKEECNTILAKEEQRVLWMIVEYSRILDRLAMADLMLAVSKNCLFRGACWNWYPKLVNWWKPHTNIPVLLYETYMRSRVNIHINQTGFAIHSRVLDCMALGSFVMSHATAKHCVGQLTECFEPDVHYGVFTPEDFKERARYWLDNPAARRRVTGEARKVVKAGHLWKYRGQQVLRDLNA